MHTNAQEHVVARDGTRPASADQMSQGVGIVLPMPPALFITPAVRYVSVHGAVPG